MYIIVIYYNLLISLQNIDGTAGTRTQDQSLKRALLYQLSYRPKERRMIAELADASTENANPLGRRA